MSCGSIKPRAIKPSAVKKRKDPVVRDVDTYLKNRTPEDVDRDLRSQDALKRTRMETSAFLKNPEPSIRDAEQRERQKEQEEQKRVTAEERVGVGRV